ncbi:hypothetical protein [Tahibacter sp.]|uniref:hypothetical protein n=1 Tax=Tahibacter sp. TaxID=2056211 RepID=UPI0028C3F9F5|nr:hypothetical protein [Tahibacter sp.]
MTPLLRLSVLAAIVAALLPVSVFAQTTLRLNWTSPDGAIRTCVLSTDASGVNLDPPNRSLLANVTFGANCPTATTAPPAVSAPVITDGLDASELPSNSVPGATHSLTWSADADQCSYSASSLPAAVNGWPTSGDVCSDAASCASAHSVPVTLPATSGNYSFDLSCRRTGSSVVATSRRTVAVAPQAPPITGCIAPAGLTRLSTAYVEFNYTVSNGRTTDATHFESIFGYAAEGTPLQSFPGVVNLNQRLFMPRNYYAALAFTVPSNLTLQTTGAFRFEETQPQTSPARMSMTISKSCGDFGVNATAPLTNACVLNNAASNGNIAWGYAPGNAAVCQLQPGETYFLNIVHASLNAPLTTYCQGYCGNTIQNQKIAPNPLWPVQQ